MYVDVYSMYVHVCIVYVQYLWIHSMKAVFWHIEWMTSGMHDGLLCFCSIWPGIKKITIFRTGTAPILIVPCIRGLRDICISVTATKTCWDNWLKLWTVYIHVHTMYRHVHTMYRHVHEWHMYIHCIDVYIHCIDMYIRCTWVPHWKYHQGTYAPVQPS